MALGSCFTLHDVAEGVVGRRLLLHDRGLLEVRRGELDGPLPGLAEPEVLHFPGRFG